MDVPFNNVKGAVIGPGTRVSGPVDVGSLEICRIWVAVCPVCTEPKASDVGTTVMFTICPPMPFNGMTKVLGWFVDVFVTDQLCEKLPDEVGLNATWIVLLCPGRSV